MKNTIIIFILVLLIYNAAVSQCMGDIVLTSQTAIDNFACSKVNGNLTIQDDNDGIDNIVSLQGLYDGGLNKDTSAITGYLYITECNSLVNLNGIEGIRFVKSFVVLLNPELLFITDKPLSLKKSAALTISENNKLKLVDNFNSIDSIGGSLSLVGNIALTEIKSFSNLKTVDNFIIIKSNQLLSSVSNFSALVSLRGIEFGLNNTVEKINAFENVVDLLTIRIKFNNKLEEIIGLNKPSEIYNIEVTDNPLLKDIHSFQEMQKCNDLLIDRNFLLEKVNITKILEPYEFEGSRFFFRENEKMLDCCWMKSFYKNYEVNWVTQNGQVCSDQLDEDYECITASQDTEFDDLIIYPNPTESFITLDYNSSQDAISSIMIVDIKNSLLTPAFSLISEKKYRIDIIGFSSGYYTIIVESKKGKRSYSTFVKI